MASLYFYYSAMNAGKSTTLLQNGYNYKERGMVVDLFKPAVDNRDSVGNIVSRIGLSAEAIVVLPDFNFCKYYSDTVKMPACILVDEAQFLEPQQVEDLRWLVDFRDTPVLCYGLRTDFQQKLFPGSMELMAKADKLVELKTICWCGKSAKFVLRLDHLGNPQRSGAQVQIGGNESYVSVCSKHWTEGLANKEED